MSSTSDQSPIASTLVADDPSFADLVEEFVDGLDERLDTMRKAIEAEDFDNLRVLAHQLKGAGGGHGYQILTETAATIETHATVGGTAECRSGLDELTAIRSRIVVGN